VIQRNDAFVGAQALILGKRRVDGQPTNQNAGNEESKPAHNIPPMFWKNPPRRTIPLPAPTR
jgi:hypothetical protein